jgi:hypothetical protein
MPSEQELEIERMRIAVEFAKDGFAGTLTAAIVGAGLVLGLAILSAFTPFKIETGGLVLIVLIVTAGSIAFGYLSLWELPRFVAKFRDMTVSVNAARDQK